MASPATLAVVGAAPPELTLDGIVARFFGGFDVVICEGFRQEAPLVVEVFRRGAGHDGPICGPGQALALVTDAELDHQRRFGLGEAERLAAFLVDRLGLAAGRS